MSSRYKTPCCICGELRPSLPGRSRPAGELICQPCRKDRREAAERERKAAIAERQEKRRRDRELRREQERAEMAQRVIGSTRSCSGCGTAFTVRKANQRFCSTTCNSAVLGGKRHNFRRAKPNGRGYGTEHAKARKRLAAEHDPMNPCTRCGKPLGPMGPNLHLDHNDSRTAYLGFAHGSCNVKAGAKAGRRRQTEPVTRTTLTW